MEHFLKKIFFLIGFGQINWLKNDYLILFNVCKCAARGPLAPYLFIICLDYVLRTSIDKMKDNGFKLTKEGSRRYLTQRITNMDYADNIALLANTPAQAETLLHSLE